MQLFVAGAAECGRRLVSVELINPLGVCVKPLGMILQNFGKYFIVPKLVIFATQKDRRN